MNIPTKFSSNWQSGFREKDYNYKKFTDNIDR